MECPEPPRPSLIVKLPYSPLCSKCTDAVSRWCEPFDDWFRGPAYGMHRSIETLIERVEHNTAGNTWTWTIFELVASSSRCRCCCFLLAAVEATACKPYSENDFLHISVQPVGSQHVIPREREHAGWKLPHHFLKAKTTEHKTYYRPSVRIYRPSESPRRVNSRWANDYYTPEHLTFILPAARADSRAWETVDGSDAFLGRQVNTTVDRSLLRSWFQKCASSHRGKSASLSSRFISARFETSAADVNGCQPSVPFSISGFRLIDLTNRCVVCVEGPTEYAALSYVWGNAARLLLGRDNELFLSTPGALSSDNNTVPRTFVDAFEVAESLSISHIWIDALCLRQDVPDELMKHMDAMEKIYSGAVLTIVSRD
jgi:hypothetical protein